MKQLVQQLANGKPFVLETPEPILPPGFVLVQNYYSAVSSGTEGATVRTARKSLLGKALDRPKDVVATLELLKTRGLVQTLREVDKKLEGYSPLGYSSAGKVVEVAPGVSEFRVGDLAACAGVGFANHAEFVAVPQNLCVKLDPEADLRAASYNALGAIAIQATRRADLRLGESCAVIGLGLVGVLTALLLKASGIRVFGIDVAQPAVDKARELGIDAKLRSEPGLEAEILLKTRGIGADAVIIAAATSSLDPINFAGKLARAKGRVVVLGDVPVGFDRNPDYYPKELELRMSRSYGPGRYDLRYEELGLDYPPDCERWTEKRNMEAFQDLLRSGAIVGDKLTTHEFSLDDAPKAYDMILGKTEPFLGVVIRYAVDARKPRRVARLASRPAKPIPAPGLAFLGAGSYAQGSLLPNLPSASEFRRVAVLTRSGASAKRVADKFGFEFATDDPRDIFENDAIDALFVATRHDSRAALVSDALDARKNLFVEKPLCLTRDELTQIEAQYAAASQLPDPPRLMVGYNRRFAPLALKAKAALGAAPIAIVYRINAGAIPKEKWIQEPTIGGGRILGEVCHFVDFVSWLASSPIASVYATAMADGTPLRDVVSVSLRLKNGSIASIHYFANGAKSVPKERIEIYQGGSTLILDDFRAFEIRSPKGSRKSKSIQNTGQREEIAAFLGAIQTGAPSPIPPEEIFRTSAATFAILDSLASAREIPVE